MELIISSVGQNGKNLHKDVAAIQELLNHCSHLLPNLKPLNVDGKIGNKTISAITLFQEKVVLLTKPDGRVDPGGKTLKSLNSKAVHIKTIPEETVKKPSTGAYKFPLKSRSPISYKTGMRRFGANRSGSRKHSGCDLYAPIGTPIYAMDDGEVIKNIYSFYLGTYALEIKHSKFIARYGEIKSAAQGLKKGSKIKKGQLIAYVGELRGLNMSMLHLELYRGTGTGSLTVRGNKPYQRRSDLIDPTAILDKAE
jgi:murein DD-endopeptidase MepM/ murein hydrolase activator NlpD